MKVFIHHIYEYKKGIRNLILHTLHSSMQLEAENRLIANHISYLIQTVSAEKINIFFGADVCIQVIKQFGTKPLNQFTAEEDFILGIMLGYSRLQQCKRYVMMVNKTITHPLCIE